MKTAVIMAWREGETEVRETVESASASIGKGAVIPVEDKAGDGPARTRHRGIDAAKGCDVCIIVDAHMRFDGLVLSDMARAVRRDGGLLCAKCYHNAECSFESTHSTGANYYAGADIKYKGEDQNGKQALVWKWSADGKPGPRACVGGACYAFRRDWYYEVGQPLAALPAWGCDEEALSITAWLSGIQPLVFDGRVAHRWRARPPWKSAKSALWKSRVALVSAVAADSRDMADLLAWQGRPQADTSAEVARWRDALLKQPRNWAQWKETVVAVASPAPPVKRKNVPNLTAAMRTVVCPHCNAEHDPKQLRVTHSYANSRRHVCPKCDKPFLSMLTRKG